MSFVALSDSLVVEESHEFFDLYRKMKNRRIDLDKYEYDHRGERETSRISVSARLSDNIVNHLAVVCGLNYTVGFPNEFQIGVRAEDIEAMKAADKSCGRSRLFYLATSAILRSNAETIGEALEVIHKIRPDNELEAHGLEVFGEAVKNCYQDFYANYWKKNRAILGDRARRFERILNAIEALDWLERITRKKLTVNHLEGFVVDVFRSGGGIFYALPNRMVMTSSSSSTFIKHLDIGHEGGHIMVHGWRKENAIQKELEFLSGEIGEVEHSLEGYIEECLARALKLF